MPKRLSVTWQSKFRNPFLEDSLDVDVSPHGRSDEDEDDGDGGGDGEGDDRGAEGVAAPAETDLVTDDTYGT